MHVSIARYALGMASLLLVAGSLSFSALTIRRRFLPDFSGAPARLAETVIGMALLTGILEFVGTLGLFKLVPIVVACVAAGRGTWRAFGVSPGRRPGGAGAARSPVVIVALIAAAVVSAEWAAPTLQSYDVGIRTFDSLWYHLPWAASFAQTGQITPLHFTDVEYLTAFYPATAELFHGLGIVIFGRDTLSPALNLAWLSGVLLAAYCVGRPRGLGPLTMTGAALAMATPMMQSSQAGSAANDVVGVFFLLAAVALLANGLERPFAFGLAALSAGLAVGVKLSMLAPVLALSIGSVAISPAGRRRANAGVWVGAVSVAGGFWYVRNLIAVGNPLPWLGLPGLATPAAPLQQHTGFSIAHYLASSHAWSGFLQPGLAMGLGRWWPVLLAAAVLGPALCLAPGATPLVRMLAIVALASLIAYIVTPESAAGPDGHPLGFAFNLRYAAPALTMSLVVLPLAPVLAGERIQPIVLGALLIVLVATVSQATLWPHAHLAGQLVVGGAVLIVLTARAWSPPQGARLVGVVLAAAVSVAVGGHFLQRHYLRGRYAFQPGVSYLARMWSFFRHVHNARVGVVGTFGGFFSYPLYGIDDSNAVRYVARRGAHGSFTPIGSCSAWRAAVGGGRFRYVVTTPARDPWHPKMLTPSPEGSWTASDPAARVVYSRRALGQVISVYELHGRLNPSTCG